MGASLREARDLVVSGEALARPEALVWPDVGERFNWAHDWFDPMARGNQAPALIIASESGATATYTFAELAEGSDRVATWLRARGVGRGSSVVVMLGNQAELWLTMLALIKLGAVIVPTASTITVHEFADRVERGSVSMAICNGVDVARLAAVSPAVTFVTTAELADASVHEVDPLPHPGNRSTDRLLLYFTSGTTSRPKLVEHTHVSYPVGHLTTVMWLGLRPGDVHLNISSPGWAKHAYSMFFAPWLAQATVLAFDYERFDARSLLDLLSAHHVTTFCAPPTVWRMLIKADLGQSRGSLRELMSAGEPLNAEVVEQVRTAWGLDIRDGYGQTETTLLVGNLPGDELRPGSMGKVLPGVPVVLVDPVTGEPRDDEGELCIDLSRDPVNLMTGYQDDRERNASAMEGGYYHTGDLVTRDADGYITFVGRSDDVFKSSDYKVSPFELESVLVEHPAVQEAAVVPVPDPLRLAVPKAYVALAPGFTPDEATAHDILLHAREQLPPYLQVRSLEFFDLPKTTSGKIRRTELRSRELDLAEGGGRPAGEFALPARTPAFAETREAATS